MNPRPDQDRARECEPTHTLDRQVAQARREMGEARWQQLQREWSARP